MADIWTQVRLMLRDIRGGSRTLDITERIVAALHAHGPLTTAEVAHHTALSTVEMCLGLLQLETAGRVHSTWRPGPTPRQRVYQVVEEETDPIAWHLPAHVERDLDVNPYTPDEQRVVDWLTTRTHGTVGAGDDPIGFLMASYDLMLQERAEEQD